MLTLDDVKVVRGDFTLLADLGIIPGKVVAVIGPSGGGKSTLLGAIAGFLPLASGKLTWGARDLTTLPPGERPVSILFQDNNLFPHLTLMQNLGLALQPRLRLAAMDRQKVLGVLEEVGLTGLADRKPGSLSGGQQSRAALARVLLAERPVVMLDEPFSALGPGLRDEMLDLAAMQLRTAGRTVLMVTHDPQDARRIADEVIFVGGGQAEAPVDTEAIFRTPSEALQLYLGQGASSSGHK